MNHSCPQCRKELDPQKLLRVVPSGQRTFLPLYTLPACPHCSAELRVNTHPVENQALAVQVVLGVLVLLFEVHLLAITLALVGIIGVQFSLAQFIRSNAPDWPRYLPSRIGA